MSEPRTVIEAAWERRSDLSAQNAPHELKDAIETAIGGLDAGTLRVAEPSSQGWRVNEWLKMAVLLSFRDRKSVV